MSTLDCALFRCAIVLETYLFVLDVCISGTFILNLAVNSWRVPRGEWHLYAALAPARWHEAVSHLALSY